MRPPLLLVFACLAAALVLAGAASGSGNARFGVADSRPVGLADGGARFFTVMNRAGLQVDRLTVRWDPAHPTRIAAASETARAIAQAKAHGVQVVLAVYPLKARALATSEAARAQFVTFLQIVANTFRTVTTFVVGNELNQPFFNQPQFDGDCNRVAARDYVHLLAGGYDALKAVNPEINVISSISGRGNDECHATNNRSTSPVRFIHDMGVEYAAMHRTRPLFDEFGVHLYPNKPTDSIEKGYQWPKAGLPNLGRLKQALWDAFAGTAQPVPDWQPPQLGYGEIDGAIRPAKLWIGETGWQVRVDRSHGNYYGQEDESVTTEARQADIYAKLVRSMSCDPQVDAMSFFGLVDDANLKGFQSALLRLDWSERPSYRAVKGAIAAAANGCRGDAVEWHHTQTVVGARVAFGKLRMQSLEQKWWGFSASAQEDADYTAGIFRVPSRTLSNELRASIVRSLAGDVDGVRPVRSSQSSIKAYWSPMVRFAAKTLRRGRYVYGIRMSAAMNPTRSATFVSRAFRVGKPRR